LLSPSQGEPKTGLVSPLLLSVSMGKTAGGSHRKSGTQERPQETVFGPQVTSTRQLHGLTAACQVLL